MQELGNIDVFAHQLPGGEIRYHHQYHLGGSVFIVPGTFGIEMLTSGTATTKYLDRVLSIYI